MAQVSSKILENFGTVGDDTLLCCTEIVKSVLKSHLTPRCPEVTRARVKIDEAEFTSLNFLHESVMVPSIIGGDGSERSECPERRPSVTAAVTSRQARSLTLSSSDDRSLKAPSMRVTSESSAVRGNIKEIIF